MTVTRHPPHRSQRALLTHWAPASGGNVQTQVRIRMTDPGRRYPTHLSCHDRGIKRIQRTAVNRIRLSRQAACRIRSNAFCKSFMIDPSRLSVRNLFCRNEFPSARPLSSTASAGRNRTCLRSAASSVTMGLSDFPCPYIAVVFPWDSLRGPRHHQVKARHGISRFPCGKLPYVHGVYDHAGPEHLLR